MRCKGGSSRALPRPQSSLSSLPTQHAYLCDRKMAAVSKDHDVAFGENMKTDQEKIIENVILTWSFRATEEHAEAADANGPWHARCGFWVPTIVQMSMISIKVVKIMYFHHCMMHFFF